MTDLAHIDAKLDRLLERSAAADVAQARLEGKVGELGTRLGKLEEHVSAEKERLDKKFETDVRPLQAGADGAAAIVKIVGALSILLSFVFACLKAYDHLRPALPGAHHAEMPEMRLRRE